MHQGWAGACRGVLLEPAQAEFERRAGIADRGQQHAYAIERVAGR
jgi:hypothetical protein